MNKINKKLNEFFESWEDDIYSRYLSWEYCYKFFVERKTQILNDEKTLDLASLNLAFYLASWGMYRGSSNLLRKNYKIHQELIKELLQNCSDLWDDDISWEQINTANKRIEKHYEKYEVTPTKTLITKILMGIFACVPAYDRFFISGINEYKLKSENISTTYNKQGFYQLKEFAKKITITKNLKDTNIPYPVMKLVDYYFWNIGLKKYEENKSKAKNTF